MKCIIYEEKDELIYYQILYNVFYNIFTCIHIYLYCILYTLNVIELNMSELIRFLYCIL